MSASAPGLNTDFDIVFLMLTLTLSLRYRNVEEERGIRYP